MSFGELFLMHMRLPITVNFIRPSINYPAQWIIWLLVSIALQNPKPVLAVETGVDIDRACQLIKNSVNKMDGGQKNRKNQETIKKNI